MKYFYYLRLFFFISFNWDVRLAWFTVLHEIRGEKKYGIDTIRLNNLKTLTVKGENIKRAAIYQGANYYLLENVFEYLQSIDVNNSIIDYGCGKGRVLAVAAYYGFTKIMGIDFAKELCEEARKNIAPVQQRFPEKRFNVIYGDAAGHKIEGETNVFFFFNPFDEVVMLAVVKNILQSLIVNSREAYIVYLNPLHKEIFLSAGFEEIYHLEKFRYIEASILMKSAEEF